MRAVVNIVLMAVLLFLGYQVYGLYRQKTDLGKNVDALNRQLGSVTVENQKLKADIEYFQLPENLAKELKARFNYAGRGEKLIIVIPNKEL